MTNLDFAGNLGHSIVESKDDRIYIEKGNRRKLSEVKMFIFEPHISTPNSKYGYKREDIYYSVLFFTFALWCLLLSLLERALI